QLFSIPQENAMDLQAIDDGAAFALHGIHREGINEAVALLTHLGDEKVVYSIAAVGVVTMAIRRKPALAPPFMLICLASWGISDGVKKLVHRKRPDLPNPIVAVPKSGSFPSGHAFKSATVYMGLALVAARRQGRKWKAALLVAGTFLLVVLIGFT